MSNIRVFGSPVHEKIFYNSPNFTPFLPFIWPQKVPAPLFSQTWIPIPQIYFLPNLVPISSVVLEKKSFKGKVYRWTTDGSGELIK